MNLTHIVHGQLEKKSRLILCYIYMYTVPMYERVRRGLLLVRLFILPGSKNI